MIELRYKGAPAFDSVDGLYYGNGRTYLQYREDGGEWKWVPTVPVTKEEIDEANTNHRKPK